MSIEIPGLNAGVTYGDIGEPVDWRQHARPEPDDSDEPSKEDLASVIAILGFDPSELDDPVRTIYSGESTCNSCGCSRCAAKRVAYQATLNQGTNRVFYAAMATSIMPIAHAAVRRSRSKGSKTGEQKCSDAAGKLAARQASPEDQKTLGWCRSFARRMRTVELAKAAGHTAKANHWEHLLKGAREGKPLTQKERTARARELLDERSKARPQTAKSEPESGGTHDQRRKEFFKKNLPDYMKSEENLHNKRIGLDKSTATHYYGGWQPGWKQRVKPQEFIDARNQSSRPGFLSPLAESDLAGHQLYLSRDGKVGAAVSPEGDIQNVFNNGGPKGAGIEALLAGVRQGGHTLDCFDGYLPKLYSQLGFVETGRMKFNRDFAPEGWNHEENGEPDVVFMAKKQSVGDDDVIRSRVHGDKSQWLPAPASKRYYTDWDKGKADSRGTGNPGRGGAGQGSGVGGAKRTNDSQSGASIRGSVKAKMAAKSPVAAESVKSGDANYGSVEHFDAAFKGSKGGDRETNFVRLDHLRASLGGTREQQDRAITAHQKSMRYSLDSHEGLSHQLSATERAAGIRTKHGENQMYISLRNPESATGGPAKASAKTSVKATAKAAAASTKKHQDLIGLVRNSKGHHPPKPNGHPLPSSPAHFAAQVQVAAHNVAEPHRFGSRVFISDVHHEYERLHGKMPLAEFKRRMAEANQSRHLDLSAANLIHALPADKIAASQTSHPGFPNSHYHFAVLK